MKADFSSGVVKRAGGADAAAGVPACFDIGVDELDEEEDGFFPVLEEQQITDEFLAGGAVRAAVFGSGGIEDCSRATQVQRVPAVKTEGKVELDYDESGADGGELLVGHSIAL